MSMAPGGTSDVSAASAGASFHTGLFSSHDHTHSHGFLSHDAHATPAGSLSEPDPPLYTKHHHHYHQVQPEDIITGTAEEAPKEKLSRTSMEKTPPTTVPRAGFLRHYLEEGSNTETSTHRLGHDLVDPPTRSFVPQPFGLRRGLQVPSRWGVISFGFKLPLLLANAGVTKIQWKLFTHELKSHARLSGKQIVTLVGVNIAYNVLFHFVAGPVLGTIPPGILTYKWQKKTEYENFTAAQNAGVVDMLVWRWNQSYFEPLGLHVAVALPEMGKMDNMDVSSTKLFRYQQKVGSASPMPGTASKYSFPKEVRYQRREGYQRVKAARKARIIVVPLEHFQAQNGQGQESGLVTVEEDPLGEAILKSPALLPAQIHAYKNEPDRHRVRWKQGGGGGGGGGG